MGFPHVIILHYQFRRVHRYNITNPNIPNYFCHVYYNTNLSAWLSWISSLCQMVTSLQKNITLSVKSILDRNYGLWLIQDERSHLALPVQRQACSIVTNKIRHVRCQENILHNYLIIQYVIFSLTVFQLVVVENKALTCITIFQIIWARSCENVSYVICEQQRHRSACPSAQSVQHLCCSLL